MTKTTIANPAVLIDENTDYEEAANIKNRIYETLKELSDLAAEFKTPPDPRKVSEKSPQQDPYAIFERVAVAVMSLIRNL